MNTDHNNIHDKNTFFGTWGDDVCHIRDGGCGLMMTARIARYYLGSR